MPAHDSEHAPLLSASSVQKTWRSRQGSFTLGPLDVDVCRGDCLLLTGHNGSGKSTLLACLAGQLQPDAGSVEYHRQSPNGRLLLMGQDYRSFALPWLSALGHLKLSAPELDAGALQASGSSVPPRVIERLHEPAYALSGGELQALLLSQMLLADPELLLLDEPFSSLDAATTTYFVEALEHRCGRGLATVVVAHHPPSGLRPSRTLVLQQGSALAVTS